MRSRSIAGGWELVAVLGLAISTSGCQTAPAPSASALAPSSPQDGDDAIVSSPTVSAVLPDGLDRIGWTWTDRQLDAAGNAVTVTVVAGLLGATESFRLEGEGQVTVDGDVLAVARATADRSTVETFRIPTGERLGMIGVEGRVERVRLDASSGLVYYVRFRADVGLEVHRSAFDGSSDVVLVELGPNHARNEMPNGTDMFDYAISADDTFIAESCDEVGCTVHVAAAADAAPAVVGVAPGGPALCNVIGVSIPFLVVYDSDTCFADTDEADVPVRVVDIEDGLNRLLHDGPNFEAIGLVVTDAGAQVIVRQRLANGGASLSLVDVLSGTRQVIVPTLPTFPAAEGTIGMFTAARTNLPRGWILLIPQTFSELSDLPTARLVNVVDGRTLEIPSWPSQ